MIFINPPLLRSVRFYRRRLFECRFTTPGIAGIFGVLCLLTSGLAAEPVPASASAVPLWTPVSFPDPAPTGWIRDNNGSWTAGPGAGMLEFPGVWANFRLRLEMRIPPGAAAPALVAGGKSEVPLPFNENGKTDADFIPVELVYEDAEENITEITVRKSGEPFGEPLKIPTEQVAFRRYTSALERTAQNAGGGMSLAGDFTLAVRFRTAAGGALAAVLPPDEVWAPDAKSLFIRHGRLAWDIGWQGVMEGRTEVNDGAWHTAVLSSSGGRTAFWVDGLPEGSSGLSRPALAEQIFVIGRGFGGHFAGEIAWVRQWRRALSSGERQPLFATEDGAGGNTPDFEWRASGAFEPAGYLKDMAASFLTYLPPPPGVPVALALRAPEGATFRNIRAQPLDRTPHARIIAAWDDAALARGGAIYNTLCVTCHGSLTQEGSIPTARRFDREPMKNGADPWRMFMTLTHGYNQMIPLPQYSARERYDVIHYLRETFLRPHNPTQYTAIDPDWLDSLPRPLSSIQENGDEETAAAAAKLPPYETMDFGPFLFSTYQLAPDTFAFKGLAVALDAPAGGVTKADAWMVYSHDTLSTAAFTGPGFVDWRGVAWDGSHGTHLSMTGKPVWVNPEGPAWAAETETFDDPRPVSAEGHRYGPLPRERARFVELKSNGNGAPVLSWLVNGVSVEEQPGVIAYGEHPVITRTLRLGPAAEGLTVRLAPAAGELRVRARGVGHLKPEIADGYHVLRFPASEESRIIRVYLSKADAATMDALVDGDQQLLEFQRSAAAEAPPVVTEIRRGPDTAPLAMDTLTIPAETPSRSWMRLTGFDFLRNDDAEAAAVCTWNGDVWMVEGILQAEGELKWRRVASGLFQPLGLKIKDGVIYVSCRDQIVRLHDDNGDGLTDRYECFNSDHQVTEHFHEFAMDLQTDEAGNFYYTKGARHAKTGIVPQHGTLLRVSADGLKTDILATGFRAPNGVWVEKDGTFYVTDQEGFWLPKNRINFVKPGGFYGNVWSGDAPHDPADTAMEPPVAWITNAVDRSPGQILRVPVGTWGRMDGRLLSLSYGTGRIYSILQERVEGQWQGGVCALPVEAAPAGLMRGRFHPKPDYNPDLSHDFFACGMTAWASNQTAEGGFYRYRFNGGLNMPVGLNVRPGRLHLNFTSELSAASVREKDAFTLTRWDLKRSADYGSKHLNERRLTIESAEISEDGRWITLNIPDLVPAAGLLLECSLRDAAGRPVKRTIQHTIHRIPADSE